MVGGEVIGLHERKDKPGLIRVLCSEYVTGRSGRRKRDDGNACFVWVQKPKHGQIRIGDWLWWHGWRAMWTPRLVRETGIGRSDVILRRYSHSVGAHLVRAVVHEVRDGVGSKLIRTESRIIRWESIRAALKRKDKNP